MAANIKPCDFVAMVGWSQEIFSIALNMGVQICAVVDPFAHSSIPKRLEYYANDYEFIKHSPNAKLIIALDDNVVRRKVVNLYENNGYEFLSLRSGFISETSNFGRGLICQMFSIISENCTLGNHVRLNTGATVTHDVKIGSFTTIAPRAVILGRAIIGDGVYVGANSTVLGGVKIADDVIIGAGAVVTKDIDSARTVVGVPAR